MANEIISKDGKYVISVDVDSVFVPDPFDDKTNFYFNGMDQNWNNVDEEAELIKTLFDDDENAYYIERNKFNNSTDLFNDLNKIAEKQGQWIVPISKIDHSMVMYVTGVVDGWDSGCCGFATVKINDVKNDYKDRNDWVKSVNLFLDELNRSENGECYIVSLLDPENGDVFDSKCGVFFDNTISDQANMVNVATSYLLEDDKYKNVDFWVQAKRHEVVQVSYSIA